MAHGRLDLGARESLLVETGACLNLVGLDPLAVERNLDEGG